MKLSTGLMLLVAILTVAMVYAQEDELGLLGRYDDVQKIRTSSSLPG